MSFTTRLSALGRRAATQTQPRGVVLIYPTRDEHGAPLSAEAMRDWQDAAAREHWRAGGGAVIFLPQKDGDR